MNSICLCCHNKVDYLKKTLFGIIETCEEPYEVIVVDDCSTDPEVKNLLNFFKTNYPDKFTIHNNEKNLGHSASQNLSMDLAKGDVLIHIEDDILVHYKGWNKVFEDYLNKFPELGLIAPRDSQRGASIQRPGYREAQWILGGIWAIKKEAYNLVGGWDKNLQHQIEADFAFRVRMDGWRVGVVEEFNFEHLADGEVEGNPLKREALIHEGVWNTLKKWNKRLIGVWDYSWPHSVIWDQFPISRFFFRQVFAQTGIRPRELEQDEDRLRVEYLKPHIDANTVFKTPRTLAEFVKGRDFEKYVRTDKEHDFIWVYVSKEDLKKMKELGIDYGR